MSRMDNRFTRWLLRGRGVASRLSTRRCRGCDDESFHTAHLTRLGWWAIKRSEAR